MLLPFDVVEGSRLHSKFFSLVCGRPRVGILLELLFSSMGFNVSKLPYYKAGTFDFEGYIQALRSAPSGAAVVLHTCAHNPTGCDPSKEQWKEIAAVVQEKRLFPIFDSAYLGFNSGSYHDDAWAIRYFVDELGLEASICLSFAKSMGLYGALCLKTTFRR